MNKYRLRFEDGEYGEVVNEYGVQLTPKKIVELLNSYEEKQEYLTKELTETKLKVYAYDMAIQLAQRQIFLKPEMFKQEEE